MMSSRRLRFTAESQRDLRGILRYTQSRWGDHQRDKVAEQIGDALRILVEFPNLGRLRDDIAPGLRSLPLMDYVVYYRLIEQATIIVRVIHKKQDIGNLDW